MLGGRVDLDFRLQELDQGGDPLPQRNAMTDWEMFRADLETIREHERSIPGQRQKSPTKVNS